jgi:hypothetical protein
MAEGHAGFLQLAQEEGYVQQIWERIDVLLGGVEEKDVEGAVACAAWEAHGWASQLNPNQRIRN